MKKSISFTAAAGIGIEETAKYYWNGSLFAITEAYFDENVIDAEFIKAKEYASKWHQAVVLWPVDYKFEIN